MRHLLALKPFAACPAEARVKLNVYFVSHIAAVALIRVTAPSCPHRCDPRRCHGDQRLA
jgi:hypothetical protein